MVCATLSGCATASQVSQSSPSPVVSSELSCASLVAPSPLPVWAREGFSPPETAVPHVLGEKGTILGVVFGQPLRGPNVAGHGNKVLWVAKPMKGVGSAASAALTIRASLNGSDTSVVRVLSGGPGPSLVDMPKPGCWTFNLTWSGHSDRLALRYQ